MDERFFSKETKLGECKGNTRSVPIPWTNLRTVIVSEIPEFLLFIIKP